MIDLYHYTLIILYGVVTCVGGSFDASISQKTQHPLETLIGHIDNVNTNLQTLSRSIRSAQSHIAARQMEECNVMGPMSDSICDLLILDERLRAGEDVQQAIHSTYAPEKRNGYRFHNDRERTKYVQDLMQKQELLTRLNDLIDTSTNVVQTSRKRTCNLNLGFHCQTEQYTDMADMYKWLQSALSPGKRR